MDRMAPPDGPDFSMKVPPYKRVDFYLSAKLSVSAQKAIRDSAVEGTRGDETEELEALAKRVADEAGLEEVVHTTSDGRLATVTLWPAGTKERWASEQREMDELAERVARELDSESSAP